MNFEFRSFPRLVTCGTVLSLGAGQWQRATAPSQLCDHEGKQLMHLQPLCFSLSVQYSINYMRCTTVCYKIGFVLNDFVQLKANISVLSIFKVG